MNKIVIFGNSLFAEDVYFLLTHDSPYEVVGFTVDEAYIRDRELFGLPVVPFETVESRFPTSDYGMIVPISFQRINRLRADKYREAKAKGYRLVNYISSRATTFPNLVTGDNCIILENAVIGPFARIGNDTVIATGAIIGHHTEVQDHCFVSPGAVILGRVTVEEYCLIGANATIKEEVRVARDGLIGSGVDITRDTVEKGVYLNPPPVLQTRRSDELRTWLMWPVRQGRQEPEQEGATNALR